MYVAYMQEDVPKSPISQQTRTALALYHEKQVVVKEFAATARLACIQTAI